jgi:hypothetical protein
MGLFSGITDMLGGGGGIMGGLTGMLGGGTSGGSSTQNVSGFYGLPPDLQRPIANYGKSVFQTYGNPASAVKAFQPLAQTADESKAFAAMRQGFAPTQQSLNRDISMQMNPFDTHVIDEINRQAGGDYSILKQAATQAGQFGSNRQYLGANDVDLSRLNQIGGFKRDAYNTALNNALTTMPGLRQQDARNQMGIGSFQRGLDMQNKQAPINMMNAYGNAVGMIPTNYGSPSSTSGSSSEGNSSSEALGTAIDIGTKILPFFLPSDIRLKTDIIHLGEYNGHKWYEFAYIGKPEQRFRGVMAQDVLETHPEAVITADNGFYAVNYDALGLQMEAA